MSLILPMTQVDPRPAPDPALRTEPADLQAGAPFRAELIQALGRTAAVAPGDQPLSTTLPLPQTAPERLDPLGAALRALLGQSLEEEVTEVTMAVPEAATSTPDEEEGAMALVVNPLMVPAPALAQPPVPPLAPADSGTTVAGLPEPIAGLPEPVAALPALPGVTALPALPAIPAVPVVEADPEAMPAGARLAGVETATAPLDTLAEAEGSVDRTADAQTAPQGRVVATMLAVETATDRPRLDAASTAALTAAPSHDQRQSREGAKQAEHRPTFADLVDLITGAQSQDPSRHALKQASAIPSLTENAVVATVAGEADPAPEGEPLLLSPPPQPSDERALSLSPARLDGGTFRPLPSELPSEPGPARPLPIPAPALLNQVTRSIRLLAEGNRSELHVKLHPAELGEVLVRLTIQDGLLQAQFQTSDAAVKATLDANLDILKARFEQQGLQVSALAVSTGAGQLTDDGQAKSGWAQASSHGSGQSSRPADGPDESEGAPEPPPARRILGRRWGSRLDHLV